MTHSTQTHPEITPEERRRALATVGIMAFGRKDYDRAEAVQTRLVREATEAGDPVETATALYNLANTHLAKKDPERAVDTLMTALEGCYFHKVDQMLPMIYCNFGVALYRVGETEQAVAAMKVARDMFRADQNVVSEAHVCDCLAGLYYDSGRQSEAEQVWHYALDLYDQLTDPIMEQIRESGRTGILQKLEHYGHRHAA